MKLLCVPLVSIAVVATAHAASLPAAPGSGMPTLSVSPYT